MNTGYKHSPGAIEKMRLAKLGEKNPRFGKHISLDNIEKMHAKQRGENAPMFGKHHSDKAKKNMSIHNAMKRPEIRAKFLGEANPAWKGGITPKNKLSRHSVENNEWRTAVFERDGYNCQKCNRHGGPLKSHHLYNFSDHEDLRFEIANGITFCKECHEEFHHMFGIKHNNPNQVIKFLLS